MNCIQTWRIKHWEVGETAELDQLIAEDDDIIANDADEEDDNTIQDEAKLTHAILNSGRDLTDEEILTSVY